MTGSVDKVKIVIKSAADINPIKQMIKLLRRSDRVANNTNNNGAIKASKTDLCPRLKYRFEVRVGLGNSSASR